MLGAADRARRRVEQLFGVAAAVPIAAAELEALEAEEERMLRPGGCVPARRASCARCSGCCAGRRAAASPSPSSTSTGDRRRYAHLVVQQDAGAFDDDVRSVAAFEGVGVRDGHAVLVEH